MSFTATQLEMCQITGKFLKLDGSVQAGQVIFIPSAPALLDEYDNIIVVCHEYEVPLDKYGQFVVSLIATNGSFTNPTSFSYTVIEDFPNGRTYSIKAPKNSTIDLADVAAVPISAGTAITRGPKGDPGTGLKAKGYVSTMANLPSNAMLGDTYITQADGHMWIWDGTSWIDSGDLSGPQGLTGLQGVKGDQGIQGIQGVDGQTGVAGPTGLIGPQGFKGDQGVQGLQGIAGPQGIQGIQGIQGVQGDSLKIKGSVETSASLPASGNTAGDAYLTNDTGSLWSWSGSAWVNVGVIRGPAGLTGATGATGPQGPTGPAGPIGQLNDPITTFLSFNTAVATPYNLTDRNYAQYRNGMVTIVLDFTVKAAGVFATFDTSIPMPSGGLTVLQQSGNAIIYMYGNARSLYTSNATVGARYTATLTYVADGQAQGGAGVDPVFLQVSQIGTSIALVATTMTALTFAAASAVQNVGGGAWNNQYYTIPKDGYYALNATARCDATTARSTFISIDTAVTDTGIGWWGPTGGTGVNNRTGLNYYRQGYFSAGTKLCMLMYSDGAAMTVSNSSFSIMRMPIW